uniref:Uncharacterized protein n=1 Tax=Timema cristinae TaxID=61476 RepID=A0A7R9CFD8_TIMCR|nr:unnamed protein product [Timema cristinae]
MAPWPEQGHEPKAPDKLSKARDAVSCDYPKVNLMPSDNVELIDKATQGDDKPAYHALLTVRDQSVGESLKSALVEAYSLFSSQIRKITGLTNPCVGLLFEDMLLFTGDKRIEFFPISVVLEWVGVERSPGTRKVEFRGVYPYVHEGRMENQLGKNTLSAAEYYSYNDLPIIGSLAFCKSDVLDHAATKEGSRRKFVDEEEKVSPEENCGVSTLDDGQLKALLDEAITYKCPKDREGKSDLFRKVNGVEMWSRKRGSQRTRPRDLSPSTTHGGLRVQERGCKKLIIIGVHVKDAMADLGNEPNKSMNKRCIGNSDTVDDNLYSLGNKVGGTPLWGYQLQFDNFSAMLELLQEAEADETKKSDCQQKHHVIKSGEIGGARASTGGRRRKRDGAYITERQTKGGSLQNIPQEVNAEFDHESSFSYCLRGASGSGTRRKKRNSGSFRDSGVSVSARQREGGSLPSNVDGGSGGMLTLSHLDLPSTSASLRFEEVRHPKLTIPCMRRDGPGYTYIGTNDAATSMTPVRDGESYSGSATSDFMVIEVGNLGLVDHENALDETASGGNGISRHRKFSGDLSNMKPGDEGIEMEGLEKPVFTTRISLADTPFSSAYLTEVEEASIAISWSIV